MDKNPGRVYWITGLAGAGKTTIGQVLYEHIKSEKDNVVFLDGDRLRGVYGHDLGYSEGERFKTAMRNARLCKMLSDQGLDVVCCTIAMFDDVRQWNREQMKDYVEIYLKVSDAILLRRDQKGLYTMQGGQVVGKDMTCQLPKSADMVMANDGDKSPDEVVAMILEQLAQKKVKP